MEGGPTYYQNTVRFCIGFVKHLSLSIGGSGTIVEANTIVKRIFHFPFPSL